MTPSVIVAICITLLMLAAGGFSTRAGWSERWLKPWWSPPRWLFGPAWAIILGLAAVAGLQAWNRARDTNESVTLALLFSVNISLHMAWSPLFFAFRRPDWALFEIAFFWLSVVALLLIVIPISQWAGLLLLPYLIWVTFAAALNLAIVRLNFPFKGRNFRQK